MQAAFGLAHFNPGTLGPWDETETQGKHGASQWAGSTLGSDLSASSGLVIMIATAFAAFTNQVGEVDGVDTEQRQHGKTPAGEIEGH